MFIDVVSRNLKYDRSSNFQLYLELKDGYVLV